MILNDGLLLNTCLCLKYDACEFGFELSAEFWF